MIRQYSNSYLLSGKVFSILEKLQLKLELIIIEAKIRIVLITFRLGWESMRNLRSKIHRIINAPNNSEVHPNTLNATWCKWSSNENHSSSINYRHLHQPTITDARSSNTQALEFFHWWEKANQNYNGSQRKATLGMIVQLQQIYNQRVNYQLFSIQMNYSNWQPPKYDRSIVGLSSK